MIKNRLAKQPSNKPVDRLPHDTVFEARRRVNGRPTRARTEEIRRAILTAAMAEFAERGFHGGSIQRIAEHANVTRATVYKQYSSKEMILEKLCEQTSGRLRSAIENAIDADHPAQEVLQNVGRCFYEDGASADSKSISRILVMELNRFPHLRTEFDELRRYAIEPLSNYFESQSIKGKMKIKDALQTSMQFMHLVTSSVEFLFIDNTQTREMRERWIESGVQIFLHGVLHPA